MENMTDNECQTKILLDISNLLDKYNIKHYLMFGTLFRCN